MISVEVTFSICWTESSLLVGMAGTFAVVAGSAAAAKLARRTRVRLARGKRAHSLTERTSMTVEAQNRMNEQLILRFKMTDPAITLFRIALDNQLDKAAGTIDCVIHRSLSQRRNPKSFSAGITPINIGTARPSSFPSTCS